MATLWLTTFFTLPESLHPGFPRKTRFSYRTGRSLGSHLSRRAKWPLGSLRARFSWEALGAWGA